MNFEDIFKGKLPPISQEFGENPEIYAQFGMIGHNGIDFACIVGTPLYATHDGIVSTKKSTKGYGMEVRIDNQHYQIIYAHLSKFVVKNGDAVKKGQLIGYSGNTGFSTGPHLHYGIREKTELGNISDYKNGFFGWKDPRIFVELEVIPIENIKKWALELQPYPLCDNEGWEKTVLKKDIVEMMNYLEKNIKMSS